jgi:hypothetical protein
VWQRANAADVVKKLNIGGRLFDAAAIVVGAGDPNTGAAPLALSFADQLYLRDTDTGGMCCVSVSRCVASLVLPVTC